jgi:FMN phosphatase YigB (HAD superfamily)
VENVTYSPLKQIYSILRVRMPFGQFAEQFEKVLMTKSYEDQTTAFVEVCKAFNVNPIPIVIEKLIGVWNKNRLLAKIYPDTVDTLKALKEKKIKLALISNAQNNNVEPVLERFGIQDLFDGIFISYNEGKLKTDGLFEVAMKKLKLKKGDVISIGDSIETDIKGAEAVGIKAYLLDRKGRREFANKIQSLTEILKLVEE